MLGETIKQIRTQQGMTQGELAEKAKIAQATLSQIELGKTEPSKATLQKLSEVLETPLPIIFIMSVTPEEIPEGKREVFKTIQPIVKTLLQDAFKEE